MRLDQWLFERGYFDSREKARRAILAGEVLEARSGEALDKAGFKVRPGLEVRLKEKPRFVGRGGEKLEGFLKSQSLLVKDRICMDVGSSTGGFTDCLLEHGARVVYSIDVGTQQMDARLREDPRVRLREQTDARSIKSSDYSEAPEWIFIDVSFISLRLILPSLRIQFPQARFVLLFKPQFEVGRYAPRKKGGVVYEEDAEVAHGEMLLFLISIGLNPRMSQKSAIKGAKGNQESFIFAEPVPLHIFRHYDIRGRADTELSDELYEAIGFQLGKRLVDLKKSTRLRVGLGRDARESSPRLFAALQSGLQRFESIDCIDLGICSTPMVYFAAHHFQLDGAFQVTASHNPQEDNGLKMMLGSSTLSSEAIRQIGLDVQAGFEWGPRISRPLDRLGDPLRAAYLNFLHEQFSKSIRQKFRVVVDCANGMAGLLARAVFEKYSSSLEILYEDVDCRFPNHPADPTVEKNLQDLRDRVLQTNADVGFAFDGDGDRLGLVTAKGRILWGDEILMLLTEKVLKERPGATIIGEVKCSQKLFQMIERSGGKALMYKTGHSLIKQKMKETGAPLAGEMSGHLFFSDRYFGFDDALYASLRVLEVMSEGVMDLDAWIGRYPEGFITPEFRVECSEAQKDELVEKVATALLKLPGAELNRIDGVRASFDDGSWVLVRASNTQAVLVVRIEAPSRERLQLLQKTVEGALGRALSDFS